MLSESMNYIKGKTTLFRHILLLPIIYVVIFPLVILDIFMEFYHQLGFRLCGIPLVKRSEYVRIDRHKLKYLNWRQKIGCAYCGYANGLLKYMTEIAARTEQYWCGIMHKQTKNFHAPDHHKNFVKYGDEKEFKKRYK